MADLEHGLNGNEHVPCRLYGDYLALMDELHFSDEVKKEWLQLDESTVVPKVG